VAVRARLLRYKDAVTSGKRDAVGAARSGDGRSEAERIGAYSGAAGLVEVGLGSTLHAYRVPFKGHALAYVQNALLVTFGKSLEGRGLFRISFISAMLKAFSPMGARFRPMIYIFLQGACFAAPVRVLGWHFLSALLGSVLMAWLTLGLSLGVDYAVFGQSIFDAFSGALAFASDVLGVKAPPLATVIGAAFLLKAAIASALAAGAYYGDLRPLARRLRRAASGRKISVGTTSAGAKIPWIATARQALRDLARPRFAIMFLVSALLLYFFTNLSRTDLSSVVVRGLCISYLGFVLLRRVDLRALGAWLDKRMHLGLEQSLPAALRVIESDPDAGAAAPEEETLPETPLVTDSADRRLDDGRLCDPLADPTRAR
jgi:hypothetical protein